MMDAPHAGASRRLERQRARGEGGEQDGRRRKHARAYRPGRVHELLRRDHHQQHRYGARDAQRHAGVDRVVDSARDQPVARALGSLSEPRTESTPSEVSAAEQAARNATDAE